MIIVFLKTVSLNQSAHKLIAPMFILNVYHFLERTKLGGKTKSFLWTHVNSTKFKTQCHLNIFSRERHFLKVQQNGHSQVLKLAYSIFIWSNCLYEMSSNFPGCLLELITTSVQKRLSFTKTTDYDTVSTLDPFPSVLQSIWILQSLEQQHSFSETSVAVVKRHSMRRRKRRKENCCVRV